MKQDLLHAVRMFRSNPGFTALALLALALGIGANAAIFSVIDAVLLRTLPFPEPERVVMVWQTNHKRGWDQVSLSLGGIVDLRQRNRALEDIAGLHSRSVTLTGVSGPMRLEAGMVTPAFFPLLRARPALGRAFFDGEGTPGRERLAILSHGLWQRLFRADPKALGASLVLDGRHYTVVGVMPVGFVFPFMPEVEVWTPLPLDPKEIQAHTPSRWQAMGRLKSGVSVEQAAADLDAITRQLAVKRGGSTDFGATVMPLQEQLVKNVRPGLLMLLAAVGLVLLIACVNVANMLLARAAARTRELAIRTALGASRARLMRQLLTESLMLAAAGGALGILLNWWTLDGLTAIAPAGIPRRIRMDMGVLWFSLIVSCGTGLLFGMLPALTASQVRPNLRRSRLGSALVAVEVALAMVLLISSGLLIKSFWKLRGVDPGFRPERVVTMRVSLNQARYPQPERVAGFYRELVERLEALPGVQSAAAVNLPPFGGGDSSLSFDVFGRPSDRNNYPIAHWRVVTPGYFRAMTIPLRRGRELSDDDLAGRAPVAVVNETMARRFWPNQDVLGQRIQLAEDPRWIEIVGVVGDVRHWSLDSASSPEVYLPAAQNPERGMTAVVRGSTGGAALGAAIRRQLRALDSELAPGEIRVLREMVGATLARPRFHMLLLGIFAGLAIVLTAIGVYGVIAYAVTRRTREIGIRMALGARGADTLRLVLKQALTPVAAGVLLGLAGALAATRAMAGMLFEVKAADPAVFAAAVLLVLAMAMAATLAPARRASRVDPMTALRYE